MSKLTFSNVVRIDGKYIKDEELTKKQRNDMWNKIVISFAETYYSNYDVTLVGKKDDPEVKAYVEKRKEEIKRTGEDSFFLY